MRLEELTPVQQRHRIIELAEEIDAMLPGTDPYAALSHQAGRYEVAIAVVHSRYSLDGDGRLM